MDRIEDFEVNSPRWLSLEDFEGEVWKDIPDYEGLYQVSNYGRVKSLTRYDIYKRYCDRIKTYRLRKEKILIASEDKYGYLRCALIKQSKSKLCTIHRLVCLSFLPNPQNHPSINHKDENKKNNTIYLKKDGSIDIEKSNLEWCTVTYNYFYGTAVKRRGEKLRNNPVSSIEVFQYDYNGVFVKSYPSAEEAERQMGIKASDIRQSCKSIKITAGGYFWRNANSKFDIKESVQYRINNPPSSAPKRICQYTIDGKYIRTFDSIAEASRQTGIYGQSISACCRHYKGWRSCGNYRWAYEGEKPRPM